MHDGVKAMKSSLIYSNNRKTVFLYIFAATLFLVAAYLGFMTGSVKISFVSALNGIKNGNLSSDATIFLYSRLPRTLASLFVGAALSVSGGVIQNVLSNKLASPSIIGVNSGAGLAVTIAAAYGIYGGFKLSLIAFAGAFFAVLILTATSEKIGMRKGTVILTGVALNALFGAFSDCLITFNPNLSLMTSDFKIGDFSSVTYEKLIPGIIIILICLFILFLFSNSLDILSLGDDSAKSLGVNPSFMKILFLLLAALLAGCSVSLAGLISFVGLMIPHAIRHIGITESKNLLPLSALIGGGFVTLSDTFAKSVFSPYEIPVGIIMAFLGVPFFIFILAEKKEDEKID